MFVEIIVAWSGYQLLSLGYECDVTKSMREKIPEAKSKLNYRGNEFV